MMMSNKFAYSGAAKGKLAKGDQLCGPQFTTAVEFNMDSKLHSIPIERIGMICGFNIQSLPAVLDGDHHAQGRHVIVIITNYQRL